MRSLWFWFVVLLVVACTVLSGCNWPDKESVPPMETGAAGSATTAGTGGGEGGPVPCSPAPPTPFSEVHMFWIGPPGEEPECPPWAPDAGMVGRAGVLPESYAYTCAECTCSPASCTLPETMSASASSCAEGGAASVPFDAPPGWEGVCSSQGAVPAGLSCSGEPCVASITIAAPEIEACKPSESSPVDRPEIAWAEVARECKIHVDEDGGGCAHGELCAPVPPDGFVLCTFLLGDAVDYACPEEYPDRHVVYTGDAADERGCAPCSCGPAEAACSALVSLYAGPGCG